MKKQISLLVAVVLAVALLAPAMALAAGGSGLGAKTQVQSSRGTQVAPVERSGAGPAMKSAKLDAKVSAKQSKMQAKAARKSAKMQAKAARKGLPPASLESSPTSPSTEATKSVGPGVANALQHIVANIMRKIEKFGTDQVSTGLMGVWLKFSAWLGHDTSVTPWETSPTVPPAGDVNPPVDPSILTTPPAATQPL